MEIQNLTEFYDDNRLFISSLTRIFSDFQFYAVVFIFKYCSISGLSPRICVFNFHASVTKVTRSCIRVLILYFHLSKADSFATLFRSQRAQFAGMLLDGGHNLVDSRGRLLARSYDVLGRI